jgi:hypothetical protein
MKVCGFTFVRNAVKFSYPVVESINSILPVCDKMIVLVGNSEDDTLSLIQSIPSDKIEIHESIWDDSLRKNGAVLAMETDKAFDLVPKDFDWAFYVQADEVIHEMYHENIVKTMRQWQNDESVEGLLFKYRHFYGTYDYFGDSRNWYRNEIRIIKNDKSIRSYRDAQGFRKNGLKLFVKPVDAEVYHYGWVKHPSEMQKKQVAFNKLWHPDDWVEKKFTEQQFDYSGVNSVTLFKGTHPVTMAQRIEKMNWKVDIDYKKKNFTVKEKLLYYWEKFTGHRPFEYKNYKLV